MRKSALFLVAGAVLASGAHADWLLSDYATVAADSGATNATYGIQTYQNKSSKVIVKVPGGYVSMVASTIASDGTDGYTANIGILHPLTKDWSAHDLTGLTSIQFEYKNSTKITDYFAVSFGSSAYSDEIAKAGTVYEASISGAANLAAHTAFTPGEVAVADFATPSWWTDIPDDFPSIEGVLKEVKNLQFAPKTTYTASGSQNGTACTKCVTPTMTSQTLDLRAITLVGVEEIAAVNPTNVGCAGVTTVSTLDFAFDDNKNEAGGYWFNFSDFDSTGTSTDLAKGASLSEYSTLPGDEFASGNITLHAQLIKPTVATKFHKYSGWAAIGVGFENEGYLEAPTLSGIWFHVSAAADSFDAKLVKFLNFKVAMVGVSDTATHVVKIRASDVVKAGGTDVCVRPEDMKMPSYVSENDQIAFDPSQIQQMAWEAKITDDATPTINKANAVFSVSDVKLYGLAELVSGGGKVGVTRKLSARPFGVSYANGILSLKGFQGFTSVDVLSLDGRKVASFAPQSTVAMKLSRGTYFLSAKKNGATSVQSFAVIGR